MNQIAQNVVQLFGEKFSGIPAVYFSPGRINLIGEHVDYNDGFVLPAAINKGIYYAIAFNGSDIINFYAADFKEVYSTNISSIQKQDSWKNYVLSVVNEFLLLGVAIKGFDCVFAGDIPQGSGMSSSAAVEGGLAFALNELYAAQLDRMQLALLCQRAEHNLPGVQCGIMDQFANMMGQKDQVIMLDCQSMNYVYFPLILNGYKIVLLNSKVHHSLASGEYNLRREQCEAALIILQSETTAKSFRDVDKAEDLLAYKDMMGEEVYRRCLYVVEEIDRTERATKLLHENNLIEFGKLMYQTHEGLRDLYHVSCAELDFLVELAKANEAVIGARLMGGGFGGCTINIIKEEAVDDFIKNATTAYKEKFNILLEGYMVATSDGVKKLDL